VSAQRALANRAEAKAALSRRNVDAVRAMYVGEGRIERARPARNEMARATPAVAAADRFGVRFSVAGVVIAFGLLLLVADRILF
jgi:D-aminopeptidase